MNAARSNTRFLILAAGVAVVCLLSACASGGRGDDFAAALPEDIPVVEASNGAIFQSGRDVPLFENAVARRVGDTVTINLQESTAAQKSATTTTSKNSKVDMPVPTLAGAGIQLHGNDILNFDIENQRSFDGSGDSQLSNKLQGFITVTVAKRLSNGNLVVRGQKWIGINQGKEYIRIQGVIRPVDILPDNSIPSYKVADANIAYGGQGALADANRPGLLSRFFNSRWNPL
jgi:flagellar L-ring protein precursor FlgH